MANSGLKIVTKLRKYINGRPTDETRDNVSSEEGYIPSVVSNKDCPVGCDSVVSGSVIVKGSTTTTTTTTSSVTEEPNLAKEFNISSPGSIGSNQSVKVEITDEYGSIKEIDVNQSAAPCKEHDITNDGSPSGDSTYTYISCTGGSVSGSVPQGDSITVCAQSFSHTGSELTVTNTLVPCATVVSKTTPKKKSGKAIIVEPTGSVFEATTTTTTVAIKTSNNYTLNTVSSTENVIFSITQIGQSLSTEVEIKPGKQVNVSSDTAPVVVTSGQSATVSNLGAVTPQEDTYTVVNNNFYNATTVSFQPYGGITDEVQLSPRETLSIKSQAIPAVTSGASNVTVTAAGSPSQPATVASIDSKVCDQRNITNESNFSATFNYTDCSLFTQQITLDPFQEVTVSAINIPVLSSGSAPQVGTNFSVETIQKDFGTSGTATNVIPVPITTTTSTTTTTTTLDPESLTETNIVSTQDANCDEPIFLIKPDSEVWYPETVKIKVGTKKGTFKFISYDAGVGTHYYKVYEGTTVLFDKSILTDGFQGHFQTKMYNALIAQGMSVSSANDYAFGSKREQPQKLSGGSKNPFDTQYQTEFTLTKTTFDEFLTVEIYKPLTTGSMWTQFEIECIQ